MSSVGGTRLRSKRNAQRWVDRFQGSHMCDSMRWCYRHWYAALSLHQVLIVTKIHKCRTASTRSADAKKGCHRLWQGTKHQQHQIAAWSVLKLLRQAPPLNRKYSSKWGIRMRQITCLSGRKTIHPEQRASDKPLYQQFSSPPKECPTDVDNVPIEYRESWKIFKNTRNCPWSSLYHMYGAIPFETPVISACRDKIPLSCYYKYTKLIKPICRKQQLYCHCLARGHSSKNFYSKIQHSFECCWLL